MHLEHRQIPRTLTTVTTADVIRRCYTLLDQVFPWAFVADLLSRWETLAVSTVPSSQTSRHSHDITPHGEIFRQNNDGI